MNERIRELARQAYIEARLDENPKWRESVVSEAAMNEIQSTMEKFAELIAAECARLAMTEHYSTSPADYDEMEPYYQGCDDAASFISGKIRRIFGVSE